VNEGLTTFNFGRAKSTGIFTHQPFGRDAPLTVLTGKILPLFTKVNARAAPGFRTAGRHPQAERTSLG